ncbi:MAG: hypothetical protein F6K35_02160, partial [Okeania sp. SIO2H7]|nr:hypothetical protein [Okeania sp. SIO2H7]
MNNLMTKFFSSVWHKFPQQISKLVATLVATFVLLFVGTIFLPVPFAHEAMVLYCDGLDHGGYP